jgi:serine/threonine protein kinase
MNLCLNTVVRITKDTVVKFGTVFPSEALNMSLIKERTTIPVPDVHFVIQDEGCTYIVMEYIEGRTLAEAWPTLGIWVKLRIVWTLRSYVSQLQNLRRSVPGTLEYGECWNIFGGEAGSGPFDSYQDMIDWYNHKLDVCLKLKKCPPNSPRFDTSEPLVFCHMDLFMQNIILKNNGEIYIIDWQTAAFYPISFEYAAGKCYTHPHPQPWDWRFMWPFIAGFYPSSSRKLSSISWALNFAYLM